MVGINIPIPVPVAFHSFGGWKKVTVWRSTYAWSRGSKILYKLKTVTSRWPSGLRSDPEFVMPTMK